MFKNILQSLLTKGCVALINFLLLIVSARYLGVSSRGEISLFILNLTIIQVINEVYTGYTLIYFIPKFDFKKIFFCGLFYTLIFASLCNVITVFLGRQVQGFEWLGYVISLLVILNTFNCVLILGKEMVARYNFLSLLQPLALLLGLVFYIILLKDLTFNAYVYPLLFSFILASAISFYTVFKIMRKEAHRPPFSLKPILVNGCLCQASILMYIFCNRYSYYLLSSSAKVGLYASASSLIESVLIIANGISPILLANVANWGNTKKSVEITLSLTKVSFLFSVLVVVIVFLLPEQFFVYFLGEGFAGVKRLMLLYSPGIMMMSVSGIISNYFSAIGKLKVVLLCNGVGCLLALCLAPFFIRHFDTNGAAYTANVSYAAIAITIYLAFFKMSRLPLRRLFLFSQDYKNLKNLIFSKVR